MGTFVEQGHYAPTSEKKVFSARGVVVYTLTSGENGTELTGSGDVLIVNSSDSGWIHVSTTVNTDKAATVKSHRILADMPIHLGGVTKGNFVSFFAEV